MLYGTGFDKKLKAYINHLLKLRYVVSDLGLNCSPMPLLSDTRHEFVKQTTKRSSETSVV